jgi:hypothetical protein
MPFAFVESDFRRTMEPIVVMRFFWLLMKRVIVVPFELYWFKLSTTLGTVRWATRKLPLRLHFFGHGAEPIEVHTRKAQQHGDLLPPTLCVKLSFS